MIQKHANQLLKYCFPASEFYSRYASELDGRRVTAIDGDGVIFAYPSNLAQRLYIPEVCTKCIRYAKPALRLAFAHRQHAHHSLINAIAVV